MKLSAKMEYVEQELVGFLLNPMGTQCLIISSSGRQPCDVQGFPG